MQKKKKKYYRLDDEKYRLELFNEKRLEYGLGDEHIQEVTMEKLDKSTNAVIVELLDTDIAWLSTYVGIAYNETEGLNCFTLERMYDFDNVGAKNYMFCYVGTDSRGSLFVADNEKEAFEDAILYVMINGIKPTVGISR